MHLEDEDLEEEGLAEGFEEEGFEEEGLEAEEAPAASRRWRFIFEGAWSRRWHLDVSKMPASVDPSSQRTTHWVSEPSTFATNSPAYSERPDGDRHHP